MRRLRFSNARRAPSVVQKPVVPTWYESPFCRESVMQGVVRRLVVPSARCGQPGRLLSVVQLKARCAGRALVLGVVQINARYAGVGVCRCGRRMPVSAERRRPERRTCRCSRPLRARDRSFFDTFRQRARGS